MGQVQENRSLVALAKTWSQESTAHADYSLHQLAPYLGRMKAAMARALISQTTSEGDLIVDPFSGSGVVALECVVAGRRVVAGDWNPYAYLLTRAKLFPPRTLQAAMKRLEQTWKLSREKLPSQDLRRVPKWVRAFFHPVTLKSALAFRDACIERDEPFLLACLLSILHHQRPGFLSYPSSHLVPYLRDRKFPQANFPSMYEPRDVLSRLEAKIRRSYRRPTPPMCKHRKVFAVDARQFPKVANIKAVITSPPYMNELDYVRDNRLRLWFINRSLPSGLELTARNREKAFVDLMRRVCSRMAPGIKEKGYFILVVGDVTRGTRKACTSALVRDLFDREEPLRKFKLVETFEDLIPDIRRSRRSYRGTKGETILIFQKQAS